MGDRMTQALVIDALRELLRRENITCSMSRKGNCWDNAMMESFFATLKKERIHREDYATRSEARSSVFDYIERFYIDNGCNIKRYPVE